MNKRIVPFAIILMFGSLCAAVNAQPVLLQNLRIVKQIPGWHEDSASYRSYSPDDLFDLIDGAAPEYIDNGLVSGFFQRLTGPNTATLEVFIDDFGTTANAQKMLILKRQTITEPCVIAGTDTALFSTGTVIGGMVAYGRLDRFYVELVLTGTKDKKIAAKEMAYIFEYYEKVVKGF